MSEGLMSTAYLASGVLFILCLGGLSRHETARRGNLYGVIGILIAILATGFSMDFSGVGLLTLGALLAGTLIGTALALKVEMTSMPELVAVLHSFVGLAAALVGVNSYLETHGSQGAELTIHLIEVGVGVFIGGVTFTGSIVAWGKLRGVIRSKPLLLPGRHVFNSALLAVSVILIALLVGATPPSALSLLLIVLGLSFVLGVHLVMAIGGADMPVVVSMLNSYSGWAAAATGFMLSNDALIITGALVGSSGAILSYIMCAAMNRSFISVILGGFGETGGGAAQVIGDREYTSTTVDETAERMLAARRVVIVPGYGMAVAHAQHPVKQITDILREKGCVVEFAIHPVAGRLPGHMNVLLAEARVPYDIVHEMDTINDTFPETDVVLVIGANDIVNPGALEDPGSPIYGMPVLEVWKAGKVIVMKRSMGVGYSGVDNPLFYKENTDMLFGDAKATVDGILAAVSQGARGGVERRQNR
jgi:NAD(P) transhydrogenase subunit beta